MKSGFKIGELVKIDPGYNSGIWLRPQPKTNISKEIGHVYPGNLLIIIEIDKVTHPKDHSIKVVSACGKVGWTFASRLLKIF